ncbi:hypothetical protein F5Y16DRAFT_364699 [Xylariaceae sp. FL0255]|nr:hypothetical protein F5Y16DRAFT_364699 [Xylariaceae sp. FL0255]
MALQNRFIDSDPGALVAGFSRELRNDPPSSSHSPEYLQLRSDLLADDERREVQRREEIRRLSDHFSSNASNDRVALRKARQELMNAMKEFQKHIPDHLKTGELPTSWAEVERAVLSVQEERSSHGKDNHRARMRDRVRKMCKGLHNHASFLKLLPSESEYASLISGTVTVFMKASVNHHKITEAFVEGIVEINDAVKIENMSHVYRTPEIEQLTMRLYTHIFSYLTKCMVWYTSRSRTRFLTSFNENILEIFDDGRKQVRKTAELISQQIYRLMSADVRASRLMAEETGYDVKYLIRLEESAKEQARIQNSRCQLLIENLPHANFEKDMDEVKSCLQSLMKKVDEQIMREYSGANARKLLVQQASTDHLDIGAHGEHAPSSAGKRTLEAQAIGTPQSAYDIKLASKNLEDYFNWKHVYPFDESLISGYAETKFILRLNDFTLNMKSQILYACREHAAYSGEVSDPLQLSAAAYISLARKVKIPVMSYFCQLSHESPPCNRSRESVELSALICSLIRQLINILPAQLSPEAPGLELSRLGELDGTLRTWTQAISLLRDLVDCVQLPVMLFVLDGLSALEDIEGIVEPRLQSLVRCLKDVADSGKQGGRIVKILFTTSGLSGALLRELEEEDVMVCDGSAPYDSGAFRRRSQPLRSIQEPEWERRE